MAERDKRHEWSFEAQWTWSTGGGVGVSGGGGGGEGSGRSDEQKTSGDHKREDYGTKEKETKCQFSTKQSSDDLNINPTITRVYHDGGSEIQMEYSWQHPTTTSPTPTGPPGNQPSQPQRGELNVGGLGHRQQRPKSFHMGEYRSASPVEPSSYAGVNEPVTREARPYGGNGRCHHHHHHSTYMGDSGYGSSELTSPAVHHKVGDDGATSSTYNKAMAIIPPTNGRCRSSCNITLEGNSPSIWSTARTQPVFHGPNCECIVCHDMQVRFESTPAVRHNNRSQKAHEIVRQPPSKLSPEKPVLRKSAETPAPTPMFRSHFCTHVRGKRPLSFTPSSEHETDPSAVPVRLESASEPFKEMVEKLAQLPAVISDWKLGDEEPTPWRHKSKETAGESPSPTRFHRAGRSESDRSSDGRRRHRYSYPSATMGRLKPRVIRIDVYCADDDGDDSSDGEQLTNVPIESESTRSGSKEEEFPVNVYTGSPARTTAVEVPAPVPSSEPSPENKDDSPPDNRLKVESRLPTRSEAFLRAERLFGGGSGSSSGSSASKKTTVPHVGPTKNKNCNCDSCLRYFSDVAGSSSSVAFGRSRIGQRDVHLDERKPQPSGQHLSKP